MTGIPKDAREVYCDKKGEPIAWCPKDSIGLVDIRRAEFFNQNEERLRQMAVRAREKTIEEGSEQVVVCIDVDDPTWTLLVDMLMPGHDWDSYRARGETPVARGVVPREPIEMTVKEFYPACEDFNNVEGTVNMVVFAAGGAGVFLDENR